MDDSNPNSIRTLVRWSLALLDEVTAGARIQDKTRTDLQTARPHGKTPARKKAHPHLAACAPICVARWISSRRRRTRGKRMRCCGSTRRRSAAGSVRGPRRSTAAVASRSIGSKPSCSPCPKTAERKNGGDGVAACELAAATAPAVAGCGYPSSAIGSRRRCCDHAGTRQRELPH